MSDTSSTHRNSVILIGGPDAGKSNFLFRLWIAVRSGTGVLVMDGLPDEVEYLRTGSERLLEGEFAAHTSEEVQERVFIPVKTSRTAGGVRSGVLAVPDVPGEQILTVYRNRQWSHVWEEQISDRCGCLVFIRAGSDAIVAPLDWATCFDKYGGPMKAADCVGEDDTYVSRNSTATNLGLPMLRKEDSHRERQLIEHPTQVILTDWIQFLRRAFTEKFGGEYRPRVGIVISAWDAVPIDQQNIQPAEYVKDNFPLLHQYIETNSDDFDFQFFGVSIVSGDLANDDDFKRLYSNGNPHDFGYVIHSLGESLDKSQDITLPVAWAMKLLPSPTI